MAIRRRYSAAADVKAAAVGDRERPHLYDDLAKAIEITPETKFSSGPETSSCPRQSGTNAVTEARTVIEKLERKVVSSTIRSQVELLLIMLDERSTDADEPIDPDDAPPDRVTSYRAPDARWGAKGKDKFIIMCGQMVASLKPASSPKGRFSRDRFAYDAYKKSLSCAATAADERPTGTCYGCSQAKYGAAWW